MFNTLVMMQTDAIGSIQCSALVLNYDLQNLDKELLSEHELMHDSLFKQLYPVQYADFVSQDIMHCLDVWLDEMFKGEYEHTIDEDCVFTRDFMISAERPEVLGITFYIGASPFLASQLVLFLQKKIENTAFSIEIQETTLFFAEKNN